MESKTTTAPGVTFEDLADFRTELLGGVRDLLAGAAQATADQDAKATPRQRAASKSKAAPVRSARTKADTAAERAAKAAERKAQRDAVIAESAAKRKLTRVEGDVAVYADAKGVHVSAPMAAGAPMPKGTFATIGNGGGKYSNGARIVLRGADGSPLHRGSFRPEQLTALCEVWSAQGEALTDTLATIDE